MKDYEGIGTFFERFVKEKEQTNGSLSDHLEDDNSG